MNFAATSLSAISYGTILLRQRGGGEVALSETSLPCRLCQEQVAVVVQERAFIEVPFKGRLKNLVRPFRVSGW